MQRANTNVIGAAEDLDPIARADRWTSALLLTRPAAVRGGAIDRVVGWREGTLSTQPCV